MADEADHAQEMEQLALEQALARRMQAEKLVPNGFCYNCHDHLKPVKIKGKLEHVRRFCDEFCRDDYEALKRSKQQKL